jgi:acyl-CoA synthetase (AMP-forming)/AMP-acid ligase II
MKIEGLMQQRDLMISDFIRHAAKFHQYQEVVCRLPDGTMHRQTYTEVESRAKKLAEALRASGMKPGDRIATLANNTFRHLEVFYGVSGVEMILHTVNPRLFEEQITYILNHAEDRMMFFDPQYGELLEKLLPNLEHIETFVALCDRNNMPKCNLPRLGCYEEYIAGHSSDNEWPRFDENTASSLCYTSGTTGNPKGVLYSHRSTWLHALGAAQPGALSISAQDAILPIAPIYHANGWALPYIAPMAGAKLVLLGDELTPEVIHKTINDENISFAGAVPTVWTMLFRYLEDNDLRVDPLQRTVIAGSAVPQSMIDTFQNRYGVAVLQLWGMTEMSPLGTVSTPVTALDKLPGEKRQAILRKQGRIQFGVDMKIVGESGSDVVRDGDDFGDIWVKGPWIASAYFKSEGGVMLDKDGWFPTGDVGTLDEFGYMRITDRSKDMIKSGGEWISSIDLENAITLHPEVSQAAVVGVRHAKWEERPLMIIVPELGRQLDKAALRNFLADKVAKWWLPDDFVFVEALPLTATGKIKKLTLREQYVDYLMNADGVGRYDRST